MTSPGNWGMIKVEADTKVSVSDRLVNFSVIRIVESNFPTLEKDQLQEVVATVGSGIPQEERVIALDRVSCRRCTSGSARSCAASALCSSADGTSTRTATGTSSWTNSSHSRRSRGR